MAQIFHPSANTIAKASIFGAVLLATFIGYCTMGYDRSPWHTGVGDRKHQPVPFSHQHHVAGLGIDCRYCHTAVESSHFAGIPPTKTCMTCHSQVWTNADLLEPVRESWRTQRPIEWTRVHNLPEYVYFNHSIHVNKGVGCSSCHGRVDSMPLMYQVGALTMEWCLQCHRNPEKYLRPTSAIYAGDYDPTTDESLPKELRSQDALGAQLIKDYHIHVTYSFGRNVGMLTNCSTCHR